MKPSAEVCHASRLTCQTLNMTDGSNLSAAGSCLESMVHCVGRGFSYTPYLNWEHPFRTRFSSTSSLPRFKFLVLREKETAPVKFEPTNLHNMRCHMMLWITYIRPDDPTTLQILHPILLRLILTTCSSLTRSNLRPLLLSWS